MVSGKIIRNILIGLRAVVKRPWRNILVLQGIIWGVALIVFPASLRTGSKALAYQKARELRLDHLSIESQIKEVGECLSLADFVALEKEFVPGRVVAAAPVQVREGYRLEAQDGVVETSLVITGPSMQQARDFRVGRGRYFTAEDIKKREKVCVLEPGLAKELFPGKDPLNRYVDVHRPGGEPSRRLVIGVMEQRDPESLATNDLGFTRAREIEAIKLVAQPLGLRNPKQEWKYSDRCIHLPLTVGGDDTVIDWIVLKAVDAANTKQLQRELIDLFARRGRKAAIYGNLFYPALVEAEKHTYEVLYLAIFFVCVGMSGMAIVIVMLISVVERSREIAIRRIEGAERADIRLQFLAEGGILCLLGGVAGVPLGLLLAEFSAWLRPHIQPLVAVGFPWTTALLAIAGATVVGIVSALLPARRAAGLEPAVVLSQDY